MHCGVFLHEINMIHRKENVTALSIRYQNWVNHTFTAQANIDVTGLIPSTTYELFCMTTSLDEEFEMAQPNILRTRTPFTLPCCDNLQADVKSQYVFQSSKSSEFASINLDFRQIPIGHVIFIKVAVKIRGSDADKSRSEFTATEGSDKRLIHCVNNGFDIFPAEMTLIGSSTDISQDDTSTATSSIPLSFTSICPGHFDIFISMSEHIESLNLTLDREVVYFNSRMDVIVLKANATVPSPRPLTASFIGTGQEVEIRFDSYTDLALRGGIVFDCEEILLINDPLIDSHSCLWQDATRLKVVLSPLSRLTIGDSLHILGGRMAARDSETSRVAAINLTLTNQITIKPNVRVTAPAVVSASAPLVLDLTSSTGAGGRQWRTVTINVVGNASNVAQIQSFYHNLTATSARMYSVLPGAYLLAGEIYIFEFSLCTFWGACARSFHKVLVKGTHALPLTIVGGAFKSIYRADEFSLQAEPVLQSSMFKSVYDFLKKFKPVYTLEIYAGSPKYAPTPIETLTIVDKSPAVFTLPPYHFPSGTKFRAKVVLRSGFAGANSTSSSSAEIILRIRPSPIVAKLSAIGTSEVLREGDYLELDGLQSFDSDQWPREDMHAASDKMSFFWSCTVVASNRTQTSYYGEGGNTPVPCHSFTHYSSETSNIHPAAHLSSIGYNADDWLRVTLIVISKEKNDFRRDETFVDITIVAASTPKITIAKVSDKVNVRERLILPATISTFTDGVAEWSLGRAASHINLQRDAESLVQFVINPFNPALIFSTDLILPSNLLTAGIWYTFTLTLYPNDPHLEVHSTWITVQTHSGPRPGTFVVTPKDGEAFTTMFLLSASNWDSSELPLYYTFGFFSRAGTVINVLNEKVDSPSKTSRLPPPQDTGNSTTCFVEVSDQLNITGVMNFTVTLTPTAVNHTYLVDELEAELPPSVVRNILGVNCSRAPDCASLNRRDCSSIAHLCGPCLDWQYVGEEGSSNTQCTFIGITETLSSWECYDNTMCNEFEVCSGGSCVAEPKLCPNSCAAERGECAYASVTTGDYVSTCNLGEEECHAVCRCYTGWSGATCVINSEELLLSTVLTTETFCALADQTKEIRDTEAGLSAFLETWATQLQPLSDKSSSLRLTVESAICITSILAVIVDNVIQGNSMNTSHMQVTLDTLEVLLHFEEYFDYASISSSPGRAGLMNNMTAILQAYCHAATTTSASHHPYLSRQKNLDFHVETNLTLPSNLDRCHAISPHGDSGTDRLLSPDYCMISIPPLLFDSNLTSMLGSELLDVAAPTTSDASATFIISVACDVLTLASIPRIHCDLDEIGWKELICPDANISISCTGLVSYNASCMEVNTSSLNCSTLYCLPPSDKTSTVTPTCGCSLPPMTKTVVVTVRGVLTSIVLDFFATLNSVDNISVVNQWETMVIIFGVLALFTLAGSTIDKMDKFSALGVANRAQVRDWREREELEMEQDEDQVALRMSAIISRNVAATFPTIFNQSSMSSVFVKELKRSHRWASLLFHYHPVRPRSLQLLVMTTLVTCVLFLNALLFKVTHFNLDVSCAQHKYEGECSLEPSRFSTHESECFWDHQSHSCNTKEPMSSASSVLILVLVATVIGIPIALALQLLVDGVLIHPCSSISSRSPCLLWGGATSQITPDDHGHNNQDQLIQGATHDLVDVIQRISEYRNSLTNIMQKRFNRRWGFKTGTMTRNLNLYLMHLRQSEVNAGGKVNRYDDAIELMISHSTPTVDETSNDFEELDLLLQEIKQTRMRADREIQHLQGLSEQQKGLHLMKLFQQDLLVGIKGDLVAKMRPEDESIIIRDKRTHLVNIWVKMACFVVIASANAFFCMYVSLFAMTQNEAGQAALMRSFFTWLALEVVIVSTATVMITNIFFPLWAVYQDVSSVKLTIQNAVRAALHIDPVPQHDAETHPHTVSPLESKCHLNVTPYLFVSHRVALSFPQLPESKVVCAFRTCYPKYSLKGSGWMATKHFPKFVLLAFLNTLNTFFLLVVNSVVESWIGFQVVGVMNWCALGYLAVVQTTAVPTDDTVSLLFIVFMWLVGIYIVKDTLRRMNSMFQEHNSLMSRIKDTSKRHKWTNRIVPRQDIGNDSGRTALSFSTMRLPVTSRIFPDSDSQQDDNTFSTHRCLLPHGSMHGTPIQQMRLECRNDSSDNSDVDSENSDVDSDNSDIDSDNSDIDSENSDVDSDNSDIDSDNSDIDSDNSDVDSDNSVSSMPNMEPSLQLHLQQAHRDLVNALVMDEGEDRNVFEHHWDVQSDNYRLLFNPTLRPYLDSKGKPVTMTMISKARRLAEKSDFEGFRRATELARRREHRAREWDRYRMLDSKVVLPFVSSSGKMFDEKMIYERRAKAKRDSMDKDSVIYQPTERVEKCFAIKQLCEHELFMCQAAIAK